MDNSWDIFPLVREKLNSLADLFHSPELMIIVLKNGLLTLFIIILTVAVWYFFIRRAPSHFAGSRFARRIGKLVIGLLALSAIFYIWGWNASAFFNTPLGSRLLDAGLTFIIVAVTGLVVWQIINSYLDKKTKQLEQDPNASRRIFTLLPLLRNIARLLLLGMGILIILPALGINIAPLLAGAGIAGIAIGFGAQSIVKDVITGIFVLAENIINIGDWVLLGGHDGQVEGLTIRHVRLRDIYGNLHTVPWGTVDTITNQTREFGYAVVEPGVAYRENIDEVIEVVKEVAAEMKEDPRLNKDILGDLQILGLIELGDSSVVIRTRFKTSPFRRWFLERDFRRRLKNRFDELGIEIPYPHSTVYFGENKKGQAPPARIKLSGGKSEGRND
ncbi:MAG: mechanosensitive ion channel [Desulfobacteraceae bacterium]|nr:mechanosensitive ion channel [Desulfobacteraceae bacterium]